MNSKCKNSFSKIGPWLMGDLSPQETEGLLDHLRGCSDCRQERDRLSETLDLLGSLEDQPVPGSFFIPQAPSAERPWWRRTAGRWAAAAVAALLLTAAAAAMGFRVQLDQGVLAAGFGPLPSSLHQTDLEALGERVMAQVDQRLKRRDEALLEAYRTELVALDKDMRRFQSKNWENLRRKLDKRLSTKLESDRTELQEQLLALIDLSYQELHSRFRQDMAGVGETIVELANRDAQQEENMEYLRDAVLYLATSGAQSE